MYAYAYLLWPRTAVYPITITHVTLPVVMQMPFGFSVADAAALLLFFSVWTSYYFVVHVSRWRHYTISASMTLMRERWMLNVMARGDSPVDAIIQNGLQQGVLFFASTTVLLIGGLVAAMGASDRAVEILQDLPLVATTSAVQWELKILLILLIFVMAFFKFAWSHRLYNYILVMIGAAPKQDADKSEQAHYAKKLALLHALAAKHFTIGLNAYFFALAAFAWFINPWFFMMATVWVTLVLYRRAFRAEFLRLLKASSH